VTRKEQEVSNRIYGIDLGTTYSCIAYVDEHGKPVVVPNAEGDQTTPSVVYFENDTNIVVGQAALASSKIYHDRVVERVKRAMGDPNWEYALDGKVYRPQEISSLILKKLVNDALPNVGEEIKDVVITCPAYFGVNQKEATKQAGELAGLNVLYVIPEPTAAAIAYGMDSEEDQIIMVYDLGGGTFDVTLIELKEKLIRVIATGGDDRLGGKDWDDRLVEYFARKFDEQTGQSAEALLNDLEMYQELSTDAEVCKKMLSNAQSYKKNIRYGSDRATIEVTRQQFDDLTHDLLARTISFTDQMMEKAKEAGCTKINKILLVGGSTYMPQVKERMKQYPIEVVQFRPNLAVAEGAALFGFKFMLERDVDKIVEEMFGNKGMDAQQASPEEMEKLREKAVEEVAQRWRLPQRQVAKMTGMQVVNVASKSLGIVVFDETTNQELVSNLIVDGDALPCHVTERFSTLADNQTSANIRLMESQQKNRSDAPFSLSLTTDELHNGDLEFGHPLPKGSPVEVTFRLAPDGQLAVLKGCTKMALTPL
jgi:molecular chaperone DnaK (HSP70)